ncbi:hypothetical protein MLD38_023045 [Melastoma candidum]|uniref:Uncharacterized protein n=1 Tax=Melastoma candidum TaxID=119954 RepID=A0ACB9QL68_9MYRT|nr:hypothetical protein MLD38_023045 [Melastoma candidum]
MGRGGGSRCGFVFAVAVLISIMATMTFPAVDADDSNDVFDPCLDAKVQKGDGFSLGIVFSTRESFFWGQEQFQLSPCDSRLSLAGTNAQLAVFRPKVDEISLFTIKTSSFSPVLAGGYMVAFAGRKYAARSIPIMVADNQHTITSFTLVLEFQEGTLQNLYWKKFGCDSCSSVCLGGQDCAVPNSRCSSNGGSCDLGIQVTFSGTDRNYEALNSWYEVGQLRRSSLYDLYTDLRDKLIFPTL